MTKQSKIDLCADSFSLPPIRTKLALFDLDGTLVSSKDSISEKTVAAVKALENNGVKIAVASGRAFFAAKRFCNELRISTPSLFFSGPLVINPATSEILFESTMSAQEILPIVERAEEQGLSVEVYARDEYYVSNLSDVVTSHAHYLQRAPIVQPHLQTLEEQKILKLVVAGIKANDEPIIRALKKQFSNLHFGIAAIASRPDLIFCNVTSPSGDRSFGLQKIAEYCGCTQDEAIAFGDGESDLGTFKFAKYSVAMDNANEIVKDAATFITSSVEKDGVAFALTQLGLIDFK